MRKFFITLLLLFCCMSNVFAAPMLTDEIPQDYVNYVNKIQSEKKQLANKPIDLETVIDVFVYSPKTIGYVFTGNYQNFRMVYDVISPKVNDKITLYIADDVYKDNKLFIKKDTEVFGYVQTMKMTASARAIFTEFVLSNLFTTDVNGKVVHLQGQIERSNKTGMLLTYLIKKNKKHLLYCN